MQNAQKTTQTKNLQKYRIEKDLHNMFEESEYSFEIVEKGLSSRWKEF